MLTRMNRAAEGALLRELNKKGTAAFTRAILDRIKTEDAIYAFLVDHFAQECAAELGTQGLKSAREIGAICYHACELSMKPRLLMRMNHDAFDVLMRELTKEGTQKFLTYTYDRLRNEDPLYVSLMGGVVDEYAKKLGPAGFVNAMHISAICYRARELAEQYNLRMQYANIPEDPPVTPEAIEETEMLLDKVMLLSRKSLE